MSEPNTPAGSLQTPNVYSGIRPFCRPRRFGLYSLMSLLAVGASACSGDGTDAFTPPDVSPPSSSGPTVPGTDTPDDGSAGGPGIGVPGVGGGNPDDPAGPNASTGGPSTAPNDGTVAPAPSSSSGAPTSGDPAEVCTGPSTAFTPLRRLTAFEYVNTISDLLGVTLTTEIPADGVTDGYDNNAAVLAVSSLHAEKFVLAAEEAAALAVADPQLAPCAQEGDVGAEEACALEFGKTFGRRAFRRDLTPSDEDALMAAYAIGRDGGSYREGIEVMIRAALQSPHFLYRLELSTGNTSDVVEVDQFELASRLSYLIWASAPDDVLLNAASAGELGTREQVAAAARSMLDDVKAKRGITDFYAQWLGTRKVATTAKNQNLFPEFTPAVRDSMAAELPAVIEHVVWNADHKLSTLLTAPVAFVNDALAPVYGVDVASAEPQLVTLPEQQQRAGILTLAGFLSVQAHPDQTSAVLRGKFVRSKLMCQPPPPPPEDADINPPQLDEGATARERFAAHSESGSSCAGCHLLMDPIGFAFENFDAMGRFREQENGHPIDASGEIVGGTDSLAGEFYGVKELAQKLAGSELVQDCVSTQWFRFATGRNEAPGDECSLATLQQSFAASGGDLVELVVAMTQTDAFWYRRPTSDEVSP